MNYVRQLESELRLTFRLAFIHESWASMQKCIGAFLLRFFSEGDYKRFCGNSTSPSFVGKSKDSFPFLVRVTATDLRIWKVVGTDTVRTGKYIPPGVYTILEVQIGKGSDAGWGRLKSGAGWIAMDFAKRV